MSGRIAAAIAAALVIAPAAALATWQVDDAGISFAYARNLAAGQGAVALPGAAPVEGVSNPAWTLLLAAGAALGAGPQALATVAAPLLALLALLGWRAAALRAGVRPVAADVAMVASAICAPFAVWTNSGLETALHAAVVAALMSAPAAALPVFAALLVWTRPEGALVALVVLAARRHAQPTVDPRPAVVAVIVAAIALTGARLAVFDAWLPQTYHAKTGAPLPIRFGLGGVYVLGFLALSGLGPLLGLAWALGARPGRWLVGCLLAAAAGLPLVLVGGGDWMPLGRLLAPYAPALTFAAVPPLIDRGGGLTRGAFALLAALQIALIGRAVSRPPLPLSVVERTSEALLDAAGACGEDPLRVASPDVGALLWSHPAVQTMDLAGLVDPDPRSAIERVRADRPHALVLHGGWARRTGLDDARLAAQGYRIVCRRDPADPTAPTLWARADCGTSDPTGRIRAWCVHGARR